jgi:hypothetical protein
MPGWRAILVARNSPSCTTKGAISRAVRAATRKNDDSAVIILDKPSNPDIPPTTELFALQEFVARHPTLLTLSRVQWALRNRRRNGLAETAAVFESKSGRIVIHEPGFIMWFLGLSGRSKPRAARKHGFSGNSVESP